MNKHTTSAIERAVTLVDGVANLADACGVSAQAVYKWIKKGYPPTYRCADVELAVGGKISRLDLLPASFTKPSKSRRKPTKPTVPTAANPAPAQGRGK